MWIDYVRGVAADLRHRAGGLGWDIDARMQSLPSASEERDQLRLVKAAVGRAFDALYEAEQLANHREVHHG